MALSALNIAIVSDAVLPFNKGGKETRIYHLATELTKQGNRVHIYTMKWWDGDNSICIDDVNYHAISKLYPLYAGERRSIKQGILFGLACFKLIGKKFDLVDVDHMPFFPLYSMWLVCRLKRKPMFATWHEVWGRDYWIEYMGFGGRIASLIERLSIVLPTVITASSEQTGERLTRVLRYEREVTVIPPALDYAKIKPIRPSTQPSEVIYVGRLVAHKNVDMLVRAIAVVKRTQPKVRCTIVGDGPERERIEALVERLGLTDNVIMAGRVESSDEVIGLMKASRVFALPSTREGFGIVVLEAAACGLQVVTFDHEDNAARRLVDDGLGIVCKPNSRSLAKALQELLAGEAQLPAVVAGRPTWRAAARQLREVYAR
jgi:glycosyltransferase involved in cell wall biosynthesis